MNDSRSINQTSARNLLTCRSRLSENLLVIYEIVLYIVAFLIPYSIIVVFSLKLLKFLRDWLRKKEKLTCRRATRRRTRGVKLVLCIVLSFLVCYTPFWAFKFYTSFLVDDTIQARPKLQRFLSYVHQLVVLLSYVEGILNPLFFIVLTERFSVTLSKQRSKHLTCLRAERNSIEIQRQKRTQMTPRTTSTNIEKTSNNGFFLVSHQVFEERKFIPVDLWK